MAGRLEGKVCVITGAAGGIGAATAALFAAEGATVVGVDLHDGSSGDLSLAVDVTEEHAVATMFGQVREQFGRIDVLFNNAGIAPDDDNSVLDTSYEAWQRVQDVNLKSVFFCCKHGIPHLLDNPSGGSVINTASFVAVMGAATSQISYTASKGGVLALSRELGVEFARRGVRVERPVPRPGRHPAPAGAVRQGSGQGGAPDGASADGTLRAGRRDRQGRALPRLGRLDLRHRVDLPRRRRAQRGVHDAGVAPLRAVSDASARLRRAQVPVAVGRAVRRR